MSLPLKPIYLLADSRLLFSTGGGADFLGAVRGRLPEAPAAAYIGASNGDDPRFYQVFQAAMEGAGVRECRMVLSSFPPEDEEWVRRADLILLAGGDVVRGWDVFARVGLTALIVERYREGALLMGVSAGAVQLGLCGLPDVPGTGRGLIKTFGLVPFVVGAHDEGREWRMLEEKVRLTGGEAKGLGIPTGGGLAYYPDGRVEAIRRPAQVLTMEDGRIARDLLTPGAVTLLPRP